VIQISDNESMPHLQARIADRVRAAPEAKVWTPVDFLDLGGRDAVDKALQRLVRQDCLRRVDRGLYYRQRENRLTKAAAVPDYKQVVDAIARRYQVRMLVDGMTAANDLGLTTAVPARVVIHTDARRRSIRLGNLRITFKLTAPSRLYWAGRPAMRVVQSLHWLKDTLATDRNRILTHLSDVLADPTHGAAIKEDLRTGLQTLPTWMQLVVRELLGLRVSADRVGRSAAPVDDRKGHARKAREVKRKPAVRRKPRGER
jgi:hypothetical protein